MENYPQGIHSYYILCLITSCLRRFNRYILFSLIDSDTQSYLPGTLVCLSTPMCFVATRFTMICRAFEPIVLILGAHLAACQRTNRTLVP